MVKKKGIEDVPQVFQEALKESQNARYVLKLYVAGNTPRSQSAIINIRQLCEERLKGRYQLEVIDVYQRPELAKGEQIIATPTLVKHLPLPLRRVIGDLSKSERVLIGLDLVKSE
jgi:circadian clock protein KaiB